jgi:hypothetical protein
VLRALEQTLFCGCIICLAFLLFIPVLVCYAATSRGWIPHPPHLPIFTLSRRHSHPPQYYRRHGRSCFHHLPHSSTWSSDSAPPLPPPLPRRDPLTLALACSLFRDVALQVAFERRTLKPVFSLDRL